VLVVLEKVQAFRMLYSKSLAVQQAITSFNNKLSNYCWCRRSKVTPSSFPGLLNQVAFQVFSTITSAGGGGAGSGFSPDPNFHMV
jgi:hypothetical protein